MPEVTIPLVGSYNQRGINASGALTLNEDQRFLNCIFNAVQNPITGNTEFFIEKRPGWKADSVVAAGQSSTGFIKPLSFNAPISAFGSTDSTIYFGTTSVGTITGRAVHFTETIINSVKYVMIKSSDGTGWFYADGAKDNLTYTADGNNSTTITDIKVGGVNSVAGLYVGQKLTAGSNIAAGSRIVSIDPVAFSAVLDTATTGGAFNDVSITKEPIAKIISSNFVTTGTYVSAFVEIDGFLIYTAGDSVNNSDLNSVTSYSASGTLSPNLVPDEPRAVARQKNAVIVFGSASKEVYSNAGNPFGSPLQRQPDLLERIGAIDQRSVTTLENDIYFVSSPYEGDIGVYRIRGLSSERISSPTVDKIIGTVSSTGGAFYASSFRLGGYPYLGLFLSISGEEVNLMLMESGDELLLETGDSIIMENDPASVPSFVRFLVYNAGLNLWSEWDSTKGTFIDSVGSGNNNQIFATSRVETDGKIYTINPVSDGELYQDDGDYYSLEVRTSKTDFGTGNLKTFKKITLLGSDVQTGTASLYVSKDDYQTWELVGDFDLTEQNPKIHRCGSFKGGAAWKLVHSDNTPFRAKSLQFEFTVGKH